MRSAVPVRSYLLDPYFAVLLTDVQGLGPIQLLHTLVVYRSGDDEPVFFVTCEIGHQGSIATPVPCLCIFAEDGTHSHLEWSASFLDVEVFVFRALEIVAERYGVTAVDVQVV